MYTDDVMQNILHDMMVMADEKIRTKMLGTTRARATQTEHVIAEVCNVGVQTKDEKVVPVNNSDTPFAPLSFGERVILMLVLAFFSVCFMCLLHIVFGRDDIEVEMFANDTMVCRAFESYDN